MNKLKLLIAFFSPILFGFLSSCSSDNSTNNTQPENIEFLLTGNYWIYERYYIDSLGNKKSGNSYSDSTFIEGKEDILGKNAFKMKTVTEGTDDVENYCYSEGEKFYMHSDFINSTLKEMLKDLYEKLPISIEDMWFCIADYTNNSWLIKIDTIPTTEIVSGISINGTFTINGEKGITKNISVGTKSFNAQEFKLILKFEGYISLLPTTKQAFTIRIHTWFDKKTGILLQTYDESKFAIPGLVTYPFEGFERKLIRYNVIKLIDE